ncbi:LysR substrate-binding domain-containing protein [Pseudomonas sp. A2]|uniref:LysR substrate-binding domain-containing protein n=1 Tax=Pseudomonas sp. A2 TaxID=107445 RepID=UPI001FFFD50A|nr:LysR substrate-binding domain-containing protein [Pseudomonas sp. A2]
MAGLKQLNWASEGVGATAAALVDLSTVAGNKISNPPWVKFQSAGWVNFPSAPTVYNQPLIEAFDVRPLFSERMVLVGPPGEASRNVRLTALGDFPLILPGLPHSNRRLVEQIAAQNAVRLNVVLEVDSVSLTKRLVAEGLGYSILAHAAVQEDMNSHTLVGHAIERPGIRSTVSLTRLRDRRSSRLALSYEKILLETLEELVTVGAWKEATHWLAQ